MANYAWTTGKALPEAVNGQTFEKCNFTQKRPHTAIFAGVTGLTFRNCIIINCDLPADATLINSDVGHKEFCGNVWHKAVGRGILAACVANCSHVVATDLIQVAGVTVDTVYYYADKKVT